MTIYTLEEQHQGARSIFGIADSEKNWLKLMDTHFGKFQILNQYPGSLPHIKKLYILRVSGSTINVIIKQFTLNSYK